MALPGGSWSSYRVIKGGFASMGLKRDFYEGNWLFRQMVKPGDDAAIYSLCQL